jgi:hypothetical protein
MGGENPISNLKKSVSNLSKGKNVLASAISLSSGGLIGSGEDAPSAPSFEDRLNSLEQAGAFGGLSLNQYQQNNQARINEGYGTTQQGLGYSNLAAQNAASVLQGNQPSIAQLQFQQNLDNSIAGANSLAQSAPVDAALAYRGAQNAYDTQQAAAVRNAALLRAQEIAQARGELGQYGNNISNTGLGVQGLYSNNMNNAMGAASGVQAAANNQQFQAAQNAYQAQQNQYNALLGAAGAAAGVGLSGGGGAAPQPAQPNPNMTYGQAGANAV